MDDNVSDPLPDPFRRFFFFHQEWQTLRHPSGTPTSRVRRCANTSGAKAPLSPLLRMVRFFLFSFSAHLPPLPPYNLVDQARLYLFRRSLLWFCPPPHTLFPLPVFFTPLRSLIYGLSFVLTPYMAGLSFRRGCLALCPSVMVEGGFRFFAPPLATPRRAGRLFSPLFYTSVALGAAGRSIEDGTCFWILTPGPPFFFFRFLLRIPCSTL